MSDVRLLRNIGWFVFRLSLYVIGLSLIGILVMYFFWPDYPKALYSILASLFQLGLVWLAIGLLGYWVGDGIHKADQERAKNQTDAKSR
jgi:hypothetical protein